MVSISTLRPFTKVTSGGYVIIDDYGHWPQCKKAIHDYFDSRLGGGGAS